METFALDEVSMVTGSLRTGLKLLSGLDLKSRTAFGDHFSRSIEHTFKFAVCLVGQVVIFHTGLIISSKSFGIHLEFVSITFFLSF